MAVHCRRSVLICVAVACFLTACACFAQDAPPLPGREGETSPLKLLGKSVLHTDYEEKFLIGSGMGVDTEGNIYVTDYLGEGAFNRIRQVLKLDPQGRVMEKWPLAQAIRELVWTTCDPEGNVWIIYAPERGEGLNDYHLMKLDAKGAFVWDVPSSGAKLECVATDSKGNGYLAASSHKAIYRIGADGKFLGQWDMSAVAQAMGVQGQVQPQFVAVAPDDGSVYVAMGGNAVAKLDSEGKLVKALTPWAQGPFIKAMAAGPGGKLYVCIWVDPQIIRIDSEDPVVCYYRLTHLFGGEVMQLGKSGLACDAKGNLLFVAYDAWMKEPKKELTVWQFAP